MRLRLACFSGLWLALILAIVGALPQPVSAQSTTPPPTQQATPPTAASAAAVQTPAPSTPAAPAATPTPKYYEVPTGTELPLVLHNSISTRSARPGDSVYLETLFPIVIDNHILIPAGSYVSGEVTEAKRPGRVHGRGELRIKLNNLILPNGYQVSFNATPRDAGTGGNETVSNEGTIKGDSNKAGDAGTVIRTTTAGAGLGAIAARSGEGAGIGAGIGAAAGLAAVLLTRGPEAELPRGTTLDVALNRPLYLLSEKANFTTPGQASTLAGPSNRQPQRARIPYPF